MARAEEETETQSSQKTGRGVMGLGMLGTEIGNTVWLHDGSRRESGQGRVWAPPSPDKNQEEGREGQSGIRTME